MFTTTKTTNTQRVGSKPSQRRVRFRWAASMKGRSPTSEQQMCFDFSKPTFSPALVAGRMPCSLPDGQLSAACGPAVAPASPLAGWRGGAEDSRTRGICGLRGSRSSASADLTLCLESRLRVRMASHGSMLFTLTWKRRDTPSGRSIYALRALGRRTSGSASTSSPTATARDWKSSASNLHGTNARPLNEVARGVAQWATPTAQDGNRGSHPPRPHDTGIPLSQQVVGAMRSGLAAETAKGVQLSPAHSRWLMGYPTAWDACADTATLSSRKLPRRSSRRT